MTRRTTKRALKLAALLNTPDNDNMSDETDKASTAETFSPNSSITTSESSSKKGAWKGKTPSPRGKVRFETQPRAHYSFLKVRLEVSPHPEGATGVSKALGKLLEIFQAAENTVQLALYKGDIKEPENEVIEKA